MDQQRNETTKRWRYSRRAFLGGVTASAAAAILAACGGSTATDTPATKPTTAPATAAGGAAATTASGSPAAATEPASTVTGTTAASAPAAVAPGAATAAATVAAPSAVAGQGKPGGSIIIGTLGEARTINPFVTSDSEGTWRVKMLFDQFVRLKPDTFEPKAGLAKSWKIDGNTFTFTLQDDAKFSDGSDLTADDVAFTMKGILAKATASPQRAEIRLDSGREGVHGWLRAGRGGH